MELPPSRPADRTSSVPTEVDPVSEVSPLFQSGTIGTLQLRNRILRSATSETMASAAGEVSHELEMLYATLARHEVGGIFTGQMFCAERGRFGFRQTGIDRDELIPGLVRVTESVHRYSGKIFAQLAHAGNQSLATDISLLAPSAGANAMTGRTASAASEEEVWEAVEAFGAAAARAVQAGFDGVHIHAANGYLISSFMSPLSNKRDDDWGGSPEARDRLPIEVVRRVRAAVPPSFPVTVKLGVVDGLPDGLDLEESARRARRLVEHGVDAIEVSSNLATSYSFSARPYAGVTRRRALGDLLIHRLLARPRPEAYFQPLAARMKAEVPTAVILSGGLRRRETMEAVLLAGNADFVALGRPFIRQPDLVERLMAGSNEVTCTSCNICAMHDEYHSLRCWRYPRRNLLEHAVFRISGGFRNEG